MSVIVVGGGIHGVSIAYYLMKRGVKCIIIERTEIAAAASGKSGGFLAREWGDGPTVQLHQQSFDMHEQLARELGVTSYRKLPVLSAGHVASNRRISRCASWLDGNNIESKVMDDGTAAAQVTSYELTVKIVDWLVAQGSEVLIGTVEGVELNNSKICGVRVQGRGVVRADKVVFAMGPWTGALVEDWFGIPCPMEGIKSTSMLYKSVPAVCVDPFAVFCDEDTNGCHLEIYPRPNGDVYVCGCGGSDHVRPERLRSGGDCSAPELIQADLRRVSKAQQSLEGLTSIGKARIAPDSTQACMRPCTMDGLPIMSDISGCDGAYVSAGGLAIPSFLVEHVAICENVLADWCTHYVSIPQSHNRH